MKSVKLFVLVGCIVMVLFPGKCLSMDVNATNSTKQFKKVILWGHKLHSHTHSYIHWGFERAFKYLGYDTYWFDRWDNVSNFDFSGSLFITEGQVDQQIPLRDDCSYILHNCDRKKYEQLFTKNRCIILQVYTHDCLERGDTKIDDCMYTDLKNKVIYLPWATDLLPYEIDTIKKQIHDTKKNNKTVCFVGTINDGTYGNRIQIDPFKRACMENNINFNKPETCSMEKNIEYIQSSLMAPALQGGWQVEKGYIPCRIFKNISYGQFGITNSKTVYELFKGKIVYNQDTYQLFFDAQEKLKNLENGELYDLMDFVRDNHTYINRINSLLDFFNQIN